MLEFALNKDNTPEQKKARIEAFAHNILMQEKTRWIDDLIEFIRIENELPLTMRQSIVETVNEWIWDATDKDRLEYLRDNLMSIEADSPMINDILRTLFCYHKWLFDELELTPETEPETKKEAQKTPDFTFKNNFNSDTSEKIIDHFKPFFVGGSWMTESDFQKWLRCAFETRTPLPEDEKIRITKTTKKNVRAVFYDYWKNRSNETNQAKSPHYRTAEHYAKLLSDYIAGDTTINVLKNWNS